jgi:hypothetical protein
VVRGGAERLQTASFQFSLCPIGVEAGGSRVEASWKRPPKVIVTSVCNAPMYDRRNPQDVLYIAFNIFIAFK